MFLSGLGYNMELTRGPLPKTARELYDLTEQYFIMPDDFYLRIIEELIERIKFLEEKVQEHEERVGHDKI